MPITSDTPCTHCPHVADEHIAGKCYCYAGNTAQSCPCPGFEASRKTANNPAGDVRQCDRRDLHAAHEYQREFGAYFDVYCPGNDGTVP